MKVINPRWRVKLVVMENGKEKEIIREYGMQKRSMAISAALTIKNAIRFVSAEEVTK